MRSRGLGIPLVGLFLPAVCVPTPAFSQFPSLRGEAIRGKAARGTERAYSHRRMSLNWRKVDGSRKVLSLLVFGFGFWVLREEQPSARWECGNRAFCDFQGRWEERKTCFWFSSLSTARHFHRASGLASPVLLRRCASRAPAVSVWPAASRWRLRCRFVAVQIVPARQG